MTPARELTAGEVLAQCRERVVPVNADPVAAIEAHKMAAKLPDKVRFMALTAVMLATSRTIADDQMRLDYLEKVPETEWPPTPAPFCNHRADMLDAIRRSIAWQQQN